MQLTYYLQNSPPPQLADLPLRPLPEFHATYLSRAVPCLFGLAAVGAAREHLTRVVSVVAAVLDRGGIAVVGVDTRQHTTVLGYHALDVHIALALGRALSLASVNRYPEYWG